MRTPPPISGRAVTVKQRPALFHWLLQRGGPAMSQPGCSNSSSYFAAVDVTGGIAALRSSLHALITPHTVVSYDGCWDALRDLDASPDNSSEISLIYSPHTHPSVAAQGVVGGWNREHAWPKSYGVGYSGADFSDLHALFAADWNVNSARTPRTAADRTRSRCHRCESF